MKLFFTFLVPGMAFDGNTLQTKSLGGSETAGLCLAREIAARGHQVIMFCNCEAPGSYDGVDYMPAANWEHFVQSTPHDVCVVQRAPQVFKSQTMARVNILWQHDLAMGRDADAFKSTWWNIDRVALLSDYHVGQYKEVYDIPDELIFRSRNGIDLGMFPQPGGRDRKTLMYCARPERGLDRLLSDIFPKVLEQEPDAVLKIATYDNPANHFADFYAMCDQAVAGLNADGKQRVVKLGSLTKPELYEHLSTAGVYVYPPSRVMPNFREISCIAAMECQAAGLPIVTAKLGALPETIAKGAGTLIEPHEGDSNAYVAAILKYMRNDAQFERASQVGLSQASSLGWDGVAEQWEREALDVIDQCNDDPFRLAWHFTRRQDIMAAKETIERHAASLDHVSPDVEGLHNFLTNYPMTDYRTKVEPDSPIEDAFNMPRVQSIVGWMAEREPKRILDVGCNAGLFSVMFANQIGASVVGVEPNPDAIQMARDNIEKFAPDADIELVHGTLDDLLDQDGFDAVFLGEVLEHVEKPWELLEQAESFAKEGGTVFFTVPYGPWETGNDVVEHLWEFDVHDIRDMVGAKDGFDMFSAGAMRNAVTNEMMGNNFVLYTVDHEPIGRIDMDRKLRLQRPRESVYATLIAGPNCEETLLWCLRSIRWVADKIIIGDTGMSETAKSLAMEMGAQMFPAPNPLQSGFEEARNSVLEHAKAADWILWIDTDEKLLDAQYLTKYLRRNVFDAYAVRQHHFSIDANFDADLPARMFRNGSDIRFYGAIHEHPETEINKGPGRTIVIGDVNIAHVGYLVETGRRDRFWRNYPLLLEDERRNPDRLLQKHMLMRDKLLLVKQEMENNGGMITEQVRALCRETIALYREHFLGKPAYHSINSLQYYCQALEILGEGFDVNAPEVRVAKEGAGDDLHGFMVARYANKEDYMADLQGVVDRAFERFDSDWW